MHLLDAFKNAIVACFLGGTLGADLFLILVSEHVKHLQGMIPVLGVIAAFLLVLILFLLNQIKKSLEPV